MAPRAATPTLVARVAELAALRAVVERAAAGEAATAVVAGDAGVGKSRLVEELTRTARADGALVLLGRCVTCGELAYAPIAAALRSLAAQVDDPELEEVLGPAGRRSRASCPISPPRRSVRRRPGAVRQGAVVRARATTLGRLGRRRPVVLVIEDLHWADGSTRDLLRFLVRTADAERLALIATYRTDDLHRAHPLRPDLVELRRDARVQHIDLEPFSRAGFADHVAALLGELPSPASLDRLYERSEGNPFFTEELLAAAGSEDLPDSVRDAMAVQLERLPPAAERVVRVTGGRRAARRPPSAHARGDDRRPGYRPAGRDRRARDRLLTGVLRVPARAAA